MASSKPLIAFYGATGGSTLACVTECLKAGYDCTTLARTPSKLSKMLLERGVSQSAIDTHLTISQGDVLKVSDVKAPLSLNGRPADMIISGIGIVNFSEALREITLCGNAANNIISALKELKPAKNPILVVLSTTGITKTGPRDVPLAFLPMYHVALKQPHKDKANMEASVINEAKTLRKAFNTTPHPRPPSHTVDAFPSPFPPHRCHTAPHDAGDDDPHHYTPHQSIQSHSSQTQNHTFRHGTYPVYSYDVAYSPHHLDSSSSLDHAYAHAYAHDHAHAVYQTDPVFSPAISHPPDHRLHPADSGSADQDAQSYLEEADGGARSVG
ncbi:hypothetical protein P7C71_g4640, partial [Lecanoromycetidae sp. Uapishka_2]